MTQTVLLEQLRAAPRVGDRGPMSERHVSVTDIVHDETRNAKRTSGAIGFVLRERTDLPFDDSNRAVQTLVR